MPDQPNLFVSTHPAVLHKLALLRDVSAQVQQDLLPAYERLSKIKGQVDPGNLFRLNSNIEPA